MIDSQGWTLDTALVGIAGTGLTFGMWWVYFTLPSAHVLHDRRERSFVWGYGQIITIASIIATGAGLHVAAYFIEHKSKIGPMGTVLSVAVPVAAFLLSVYGLYAYLIARFDRFHIWLLLGSAIVIGVAIAAAAAGLNMAHCLIILMFAPFVSVVGYEMVGHKHQAEALSNNRQL